MDVARPEFLPDPDRSHEEMEVLQREIGETARFVDDFDFDPDCLGVGDGVTDPGTSQGVLDGGPDSAAPIVAGVDQAFLDDDSVSAVVAIQDGVVIERVCGHAPLEIPYIPGLLAFREGSAIVHALRKLSVDPDLLVVDGHGRSHYRQAGIATHVGVLFDVPAVGVAKNLLCGDLAEQIDDPLPAGTRIPIYADEEMTAPAGEVVGYVYQSRQFPNPERRHVNPIYVSSGHRVAAETAVDLVAALCAGYKLPEPTRLADAHAEVCKDEVGSTESTGET